MKQEDAEDLQKKIMSAKFDFNDFLKQTRAVAQMGTMSRVLGMIPGMGKVIYLLLIKSISPFLCNKYSMVKFMFQLLLCIPCISYNPFFLFM